MRARLRRAYSTEELEQSVVTGEGSGWGRVTVLCVSEATLRAQLAEGIRAGAADGDAPQAVIECVIDLVIGSMSTTQLRALLAAGDEGQLRQLGTQAGLDCARAYRSGLLKDRLPSAASAPAPAAAAGGGRDSTERYLDCVAENPNAIDRCAH
jgi:hypothetical protein